MSVQTRNSLIGLILTIVNGIFSFAGNGQTPAEARILRDHNPQTYIARGAITKTFGYPFCEDILNLRRQENQKLIELGVTNSGLLKQRMRYDEISSDRENALDLPKLMEQQKPNSDRPKRQLYARQEKRRNPGGGGSGYACFTWKTTVTVLMSKVPGRSMPERSEQVTKTETQIEKLHAIWDDDVIGYGWVLSSTLAYFPDDKRYHVDCWATILDTIYSDLETGDDIVVTELGRGESDHRTLESTPDHRFLTTKLEWKAASDLAIGEEIYAGESHAPYRVLRKTKHIIEHGWIHDDPSARIFNLTTETSDFYVGPEDHRVLAHNFR